MKTNISYIESVETITKIKITKAEIPNDAQWLKMGPDNRIFDDWYPVKASSKGNRYNPNNIYLACDDYNNLYAVNKMKKKFDISLRPIIEFVHDESLPKKEFDFILNGYKFHSYATGRAIAVDHIYDIKDFQCIDKDHAYNFFNDKLNEWYSGLHTVDGINIYEIKYTGFNKKTIDIDISDFGLPKKNIIDSSLSVDQKKKYGEYWLLRENGDYGWSNVSKYGYVSCSSSYITDILIVPYIEFLVDSTIEKTFVQNDVFSIKGASFLIISATPMGHGAMKYCALCRTGIVKVKFPSSFRTPEGHQFIHSVNTYLNEWFIRLETCSKMTGINLSTNNKKSSSETTKNSTKDTTNFTKTSAK